MIEVVIAARNEEKLLPRCLEALSRQSIPVHPIVARCKLCIYGTNSRNHCYKSTSTGWRRWKNF